MTDTPADRGAPHDDTAHLHRLGYAQELFRSMGGFQNFAISFTIISILAGCLTSYSIAYNHGGPVAITCVWLIVGGFCIIVSLALGESASTYPTAGGHPRRRSRPSPVSELRLHTDGQQHRVQRRQHARDRLHLHLPDRAADGPVHDHRLRRIGAHERGDP